MFKWHSNLPVEYEIISVQCTISYTTKYPAFCHLHCTSQMSSKMRYLFLPSYNASSPNPCWSENWEVETRWHAERIGGRLKYMFGVAEVAGGRGRTRAGRSGRKHATWWVVEQQRTNLHDLSNRYNDLVYRLQIGRVDSASWWRVANIESSAVWDIFYIIFEVRISITKGYLQWPTLTKPACSTDFTCAFKKNYDGKVVGSIYGLVSFDH